MGDRLLRFLEKALDCLSPEELQSVTQRLARERALFEVLINAIEDGVLVTDLEGRILLFNSAVVRLLGIPDQVPDEHTVERYLPDLSWGEIAQAARNKKGVFQRHEFQITYPTQRFLRLEVASLNGIQNDEMRVALVLHDVTEAKKKTFEAMESERVAAVLAAGLLRCKRDIKGNLINLVLLALIFLCVLTILTIRSRAALLSLGLVLALLLYQRFKGKYVLLTIVGGILLFEVGDFSVVFLFFYLCLGCLGGGDSPHLVEGVHVERQVVELSLVVGYGGVGVAVEFHEGVHEVPYFAVVGVEDVGSVLVDVDAADVFAPEVPACVAALVYYQYFPACLVEAVGDD